MREIYQGYMGSGAVGHGKQSDSSSHFKNLISGFRQLLNFFFALVLIKLLASLSDSNYCVIRQAFNKPSSIAEPFFHSATIYIIDK